MGQVPAFKIAIIGNGRVSRHFQFYLKNSNIIPSVWDRKKDQSLQNFYQKTQPDVILILIKDSSISTLINDNPYLKESILIHFSGSLTIPGTVGMHPLMSFSTELYPFEFYQAIPFICENSEITFNSVFPTLKNPIYLIRHENKAFYHSLCVLAGNFSVILWQKLFSEFESRLEIPKEAAFPYLEQITKNLISNPSMALTGPIQRKYELTIATNLNSLSGDIFEKVYRSFLEIYK